MAIFEPVVEATEAIEAHGLHTFEHGLGTMDVLVELLDADGQLIHTAFTLWNSDTLRIAVPRDAKLPATLRVVG